MHNPISTLFRASLIIFCVATILLASSNGNAQLTSVAHAASSHASLGDVESISHKDLLIRFREDSTADEREIFLRKISGQLLLWIEPLNAAKVRVPINYVASTNTLTVNAENSDDVNTVEAASASTTASLQQLLELNSVTLSVEEDGEVYGTFNPSDPDLYDTQRVYTAELLNLFSAWDYTTGISDVTIAVLDTGITSAHPEFNGRIKQGYDFYNDDEEPEDDHGHGTHVAGTIAAAIDNGIGGAGLCGGCSLLPIKVLNQNNAGTWAGVAAGIIFAADNDADVIVMSLGSTSDTQVVEDAIEYAISKDVVVVAAAGNANSNRNFYPAAYEGVIGVAATNQNDERWVLSNYGSYVDVSAPGHVIYSTSNDLDNSYNGHVFMSGTSMATPHVGGLIGLLKSQDMSRTGAEITEILLSTAVDLGEPGRDEYFGMGRIDPAAALSLYSTPQAVADLSGGVWEDINADGLLGANESERISDVQITLYDAKNQKISTVKSDDAGNWQFADLQAGSYRIAVAPANSELIWTTQNQAEITLAPGQQVTNKMIGFVDELPTNVVEEVKAYREGSDVVITWQVTSDLVTGLNLERSIDDGEYEVIKRYDLTSTVSSSSSQSFADTLPANIGDKSVLYRIQITPGDTYVSTIEASNETDITPPLTAIPPNVERSVSDNLVFVPLMYSQR